MLGISAEIGRYIFILYIPLPVFQFFPMAFEVIKMYLFGQTKLPT